MVEMTVEELERIKEELDIEIAEKMARLPEKQRKLLETFDWINFGDEKAILNRRLKEAKHRLWTEILQHPDRLERLVQYIKDNTPCSLCHKKGVMLARKDDSGDWFFICEDCIIRNQTHDIVKVYKSNGSMEWEWKNE